MKHSGNISIWKQNITGDRGWGMKNTMKLLNEDDYANALKLQRGRSCTTLKM
jgi:hypothetical protein